MESDAGFHFFLNFLAKLSTRFFFLTPYSTFSWITLFVEPVRLSGFHAPLRPIPAYLLPHLPPATCRIRPTSLHIICLFACFLMLTRITYLIPTRMPEFHANDNPPAPNLDSKFFQQSRIPFTPMCLSFHFYGCPLVLTHIHTHLKSNCIASSCII